jgi:hypothetical protein
MPGQYYPQELNPDFRDVLFELYDAGVEFMVIGAYAYGFHMRPRSTGDIDVWVRPTPENAALVWKALVTFGAPLIGMTPEDFASPRFIYQIGVDPVRVDILTRVSGVEFDECWPRSIPGFLADVPVRFLGFDDLLAAKDAAGRPKDKRDAAALRRRKKKLESQQ